MLDAWNNLCLTVGDALFGSLLGVSVDLVLVVLAFITCGLMLLTRRCFTNQDLLARVEADRVVLKQKRIDAKMAGDRDTVERIKKSEQALSLYKLSQEFKPLVAVIVPVAILATWAAQRLEFHPPRQDEPIEFLAYFPLTAIGDVVHLVPESGLESKTGWVQSVAARPNEPGWFDKLIDKVTFRTPTAPEPDAIARWTLEGESSQKPYELLIRWKDETVRRDLLIGQRTYSPAIGTDATPVTTELVLRPIKPFGFIPGLSAFLPGWLVGYLLIVFPLTSILKRLTRTY